MSLKKPAVSQCARNVMQAGGGGYGLIDPTGSVGKSRNKALMLKPTQKYYSGLTGAKHFLLSKVCYECLYKTETK